MTRSRVALTMLKDQKEALTGARKPDLTHVRRAFGVYIARPCEYGTAKGYERANYLRPAAPPPDERQRAEPMAADFLRLRAYLRAAKSHIDAALDSLEQHEAGDPALTDRAGMLAAAYAADTDIMPGAPIGASGLPHIAHGAASLQMAICQAVRYGLLPEDPGRPWDVVRASSPPLPCGSAECDASVFCGPHQCGASEIALAAARAREPGVYDVTACAHTSVDRGDEFNPDRCRGCHAPIFPECIAQAPVDPHAALRAEIAAAGLPPAPDEALEGRKLVRGRSNGWGSTASDVWAFDGNWSMCWFGIGTQRFYLVPKDWT